VEDHLVIVAGEQACIADGDAMRVVAQVVEQLWA
jgi:hypothetical protein